MALPSLTIPVVYSVMDIVIAYSLSTITQLKQQRDALKGRLEVERDIQPISPSTVAALYLFNPLTILSCVSKSTLLVTNLSIVLSLLSALKGKTRPTMFWIALASYLSFYPTMLLPALLLVLDNRKVKKERERMIGVNGIKEKTE